ncbi:MAG: histidine kinase [Flavobacteriales bacterium]|nr:MAG: histidine kinase [Flavobacteriales bacterium]
MDKRKKLYWISQLSGWSLYVFLGYLLNQLTGKPFSVNLLITLIAVFVIGIGTSHFYRKIIIKFDWLRFGIMRLIPRAVLASLAFGIIFQLLYMAVIWLLIDKSVFTSKFAGIAVEYLGWTTLYVIWSLIYFVFHFFENYRKEEIKNLQWEAAKNEMELNKLKSQLNPHFLFNSMNSIKALIKENPEKAKKSVTQLSNILRNSLQMGKKKEIPFAEELNLVKDYLELESVRYEERLQVDLEIHPESHRFSVPPLMIQTLVENGIKHGISKLPKGGKLALKTDVIDEKLIVKITNNGQLNGTASTKMGYGIKNTKERLKLLYGDESSFSINGAENKVTTEIVIPKTNKL